MLTRETGARLRAEILEAATTIAARYGFTTVEADSLRYDGEAGMFRLRVEGFTPEAVDAKRAALVDKARAAGFNPTEPGEGGAVLVDHNALRDTPWVYERDGERRACSTERARAIWPAV